MTEFKVKILNKHCAFYHNIRANTGGLPMCIPVFPKGYSLFLKDLNQILDCSQQDFLLLKGASLFLVGDTNFIG